MSPDNRKRLREEVENGGWIIIWAGANMPVAYLNEPVELIYENMDGQPEVCNAVYTYGDKRFAHFRRTDGVVMVKCIAWRYRAKE